MYNRSVSDDDAGRDVARRGAPEPSQNDPASHNPARLSSKDDLAYVADPAGSKFIGLCSAGGDKTCSARVLRRRLTGAAPDGRANRELPRVSASR